MGTGERAVRRVDPGHLRLLAITAAPLRCERRPNPPGGSCDGASPRRSRAELAATSRRGVAARGLADVRRPLPARGSRWGRARVGFGPCGGGGLLLAVLARIARGVLDSLQDSAPLADPLAPRDASTGASQPPPAPAADAPGATEPTVGPQAEVPAGSN